MAQASDRWNRFVPALIAVALSSLVFEAGVCGQDRTPVPQPVRLQNLIAPAQMAFLSGYAGYTTKELLKDKRFKALMKLTMPRTEYHYGRDMPLSDSVDLVLSGSTLPVNVHDSRYVVVTGTEGPYLRGRGMMWFDLQEGIALGAFYFTPVNGEPTPTLTVFSRQLLQSSLSLGELPHAFADDLSQWTLVAGIPAISPRYFIPENGRKYVLEHDEDYCRHAAGTPEPPQVQCMQANLAAADADMNAAYFMKETRNAANATAWMLGPEQIAWLAMRESTCIGPDGLGCRIRMAHERTRVILGPTAPRPRPMQSSR